MLIKNKDYFELDSGIPGSNLLVLGAIHGDEVCGPIAINNLIKNPPTLDRGRLTFVPICNNNAYEKGTRFVDQNMNRIFYPHPRPENAEQERVNDIIPLFDAADMVLDLHSMSCVGTPFAFCDVDAPEWRAATGCLGLPHILMGWPEIGVKGGELSTGDYAIKNGKICITIEAGEHRDPQAINAAETAILRLAAHLGMIAPMREDFQPAKFLLMTGRIEYDGRGTFSKEWKNFDFVPAGTWITDAHQAKEDAYIIMPKISANPIIGEKLFYLGRLVS